MSRSPLSRSVSTLMRPTFMIPVGASLGTAASRLRENSAGVLPICDGQTFVGAISEASFAQAISNGANSEDDVKVAHDSRECTIKIYESGAEALRRFEGQNLGALIVIDDNQLVAGVLRASDLVDSPSYQVRPPSVGGMATPFGVYLTSGVESAGVPALALVLTGAMLFVIATVSAVLAESATSLLETRHVAPWALDIVQGNLWLALFALSFRLLPISGIHAAEHMVVHAIERGEPLVPSVVKRMPRVHPRCGTNLAVGSTFFLWIATFQLIQPDQFRLLLALVATVLLWRPLGSAVQYFITTKQPSDKQIQMGIRSGKELLEKHSRSKNIQVGFFGRLLHSGLFHVMAGSILVTLLLYLLKALFPNLPIPEVV